MKGEGKKKNRDILPREEEVIGTGKLILE